MQTEIHKPHQCSCGKAAGHGSAAKQSAREQRAGGGQTARRTQRTVRGAFGGDAVGVLVICSLA